MPRTTITPDGWVVNYVETDQTSILPSGWVVNATVASADATAPNLSLATTDTITKNGLNCKVTTDEGNGSLYCIVTTSGTTPSVAQIQAGTDNNDVAAAFSNHASPATVSGTGVQTVAATGLVAETAYYAHFQHQDAATNDSVPTSTAQFTMADATYTEIYTQTITGLTGVPDGSYTVELSVLGVLTLTSIAGKSKKIKWLATM